MLVCVNVCSNAVKGFENIWGGDKIVVAIVNINVEHLGGQAFGLSAKYLFVLNFEDAWLLLMNFNDQLQRLKES